MRYLATSLTTFIFFVISITGIFMFFHLFDNYTKDLHEILGLAFVFIVFFHIFYNWKSMKNYFSKKVFLQSGLVILIVSSLFILNAKSGENPKKVIIESILKTPIQNLTPIFEVDLKTITSRLQKEDLKFIKTDSIEDISKLNKVSPFKIVKLIIKK